MNQGRLLLLLGNETNLILDEPSGQIQESGECGVEHWTLADQVVWAFAKVVYMHPPAKGKPRSPPNPKDPFPPSRSHWAGWISVGQRALWPGHERPIKHAASPWGPALWDTAPLPPPQNAPLPAGPQSQHALLPFDLSFKGLKRCRVRCLLGSLFTWLPWQPAPLCLNSCVTSTIYPLEHYTPQSPLCGSGPQCPLGWDNMGLLCCCLLACVAHTFKSTFFF